MEYSLELPKEDSQAKFIMSFSKFLERLMKRKYIPQPYRCRYKKN